MGRRFGIAVAAGVFLISSLGVASLARDHSRAAKDPALVSRQRASRQRASRQYVSVQDRRLLYQAEQILISNCMSGLGFRYWMLPFAGQGAPAQPAPLVLDDIGRAKRLGFPVAPPIPVFNSHPENSYLAGLSPARRAAWTAALTGNPGGAQRVPGVQVRLPEGLVLGHSRNGCVAQAEGKLYGNYQAWFAAANTVRNLEPVWTAEVLADQRYSRANRHWSRCMTARGYSLASPAEASARFTGRSGHQRHAAEIAAAVAEATCADATGLATISSHLQSHYSGVLDQQYRKEIDSYKDLMLAALPAARTIAASR